MTLSGIEDSFCDRVCTSAPVIGNVTNAANTVASWRTKSMGVPVLHPTLAHESRSQSEQDGVTWLAVAVPFVSAVVVAANVTALGVIEHSRSTAADACVWVCVDRSSVEAVQESA